MRGSALLRQGVVEVIWDRFWNDLKKLELREKICSGRHGFL